MRTYQDILLDSVDFLTCNYRLTDTEHFLFHHDTAVPHKVLLDQDECGGYHNKEIVYLKKRSYVFISYLSGLCPGIRSARANV